MSAAQEPESTTREDRCPACGSRRYQAVPLEVGADEPWREGRKCLDCGQRYVRVFGPQ
jgi:DNA-directed RNA polymerase subunit RPC12/RpoP